MNKIFHPSLIFSLPKKPQNRFLEPQHHRFFITNETIPIPGLTLLLPKHTKRKANIRFCGLANTGADIRPGLAKAAKKGYIYCTATNAETI
ncbi:hypothetical protein [Neisseria shayeganii]|uniref:hypothetical protein n=1 Tax=Neisseria shayeganii TaxID=607712 RepID=UPI0012EA376C|nr:hypothetical protein [Neisseria shayeganii]